MYVFIISLCLVPFTLFANFCIHIVYLIMSVSIDVNLKHFSFNNISCFQEETNREAVQFLLLPYHFSGASGKTVVYDNFNKERFAHGAYSMDSD